MVAVEVAAVEAVAAVEEVAVASLVSLASLASLGEVNFFFKRIRHDQFETTVRKGKEDNTFQKSAGDLFQLAPFQVEVAAAAEVGVAAAAGQGATEEHPDVQGVLEPLVHLVPTMTPITSTSCLTLIIKYMFSLS